MLSLMLGFNPRARMGRDHDLYVVMRPVPSFNPRARMGRDNLITMKVSIN